MPSNTSLITLIAALLGTAAALPSTAPPNVPRSCSVTYPTSMTILTQNGESASSLNDFCIDNTKAHFVEFADIPTNAVGACQLEFVFPPRYEIAGTGNHQVNVWKTSRSVRSNDTWATAPKPLTTFGTVVLNSKEKEEARIVVNSGSCDSMRHFKVGMADNEKVDNGEGVVFWQLLPPAAQVAGMRIVYGC